MSITRICHQIKRERATPYTKNDYHKALVFYTPSSCKILCWYIRGTSGVSAHLMNSVINTQRDKQTGTHESLFASKVHVDV